MPGPLLITGLGNPGAKYEQTRHNVGFEVVDRLAERWGVSFVQKFNALFGETLRADRKVLLLKPQTYMNRSGLAVAEAVGFFKLEPQHSLLVISDDLDLPTGSLRIRKEGGSGGHNGLKSIIESLGTEAFARLRIGIGRSAGAVEHVLGKIGNSEKELYEQTLQRASEAVEAILTVGLEKAMSEYNRKIGGQSA